MDSEKTHCETHCKQCTQQGLPILFTRYAAAYSVQGDKMAALRDITPKGQFQATPNGVMAQTATYNVRMLRPGYLYLYIEDLCRKPYWDAYVVHPHGYLNPFPVEEPQSAAMKVACKREARQANNSLVWVDAQTVTKLWYMFSSDPLDYQHLKNEIEKNLGKYTQSVDVAGWLNGSQNQPDTCKPGELDAQVVEYAALKNEVLRDAMEPQLYGLMGASPSERGWGDYEENVTNHYYSGRGGKGATVSYARIHKQPAYDVAHGERLEGMRKFLIDNKGMVAACEDPLGISQELGHLQVEAQTWYTHWQLSQAKNFAGKVSNEWAFQSAVGGKGLADMVKKKAIATAESGMESDEEFDRRFSSIYDNSHLFATEAEKNKWKETLRARQKDAASKKLEKANEIGDPKFYENYNKYFDLAAADTIIKEQESRYEELQQRLETLGKDQVVWLQSKALLAAMGRYSAKDDRIGRDGGGAALSLQLAHCFAGTENNRAGLKHLESLEPEGDNQLARVINFGSAMLAQTYREIEAEAAKLPVYDPKAEPTTALADKVSGLLKQFKAGLSQADRALNFIEKHPGIGQSGQLRQQAWLDYVSTLMGVKLLQKVKNLPASKVETWLIRRVALTGLSTLGSNAAQYAEGLSRAQQDRVRNAANKMLSKGYQGSQDAAMKGAGGLRVAGLSTVLDLGMTVMKGYQVQANATARGASELVGSLLKTIGSMADYRAKAFEKTIYADLKQANIFTAPGMKQALSEVNAMQLRALRMTAFKFALPAAVISVYWDVMDAVTSYKRSDYMLTMAQAASAVGTLFSVASTVIGVFGLTAGASWASAALALGLIGAVIAVGVIVAVWILKEGEWVNWLKDNPLNKERKGKPPIHDDLKETLQKLANVQAELQGG